MTKLSIHLPDGSTRKIAPGTPVSDVLEKDGRILAALVDNLTVALDYRLVRSASVRPLTYASREGNEVYRRSLSFILCAAVSRVFPKSQLVIGHSLAGGYYYDMISDKPLDAERLKKIEEEMRRIIAADMPLHVRFISVTDALDLFERIGRDDKVSLLQRSLHHDMPLYELEGFYDMPIGPLAPSTGRLAHFALSLYPPGIVLRFPEKRDLTRMPTAADQTRLFAVYHESKKWSQILQIENVGDLNKLIGESRFHECVQVAEALHEKKIAAIADSIRERVPATRLVFIAGPSASGKTTFAKRLSVQLRVNGLRPIAIGLDDYFVDRDRTPRDEKGEYDFESLHALDIETFNEHLVRLLAGEEVTIPHYDFKQGKSLPGDKKLHIESDQVLIVEGIHGLNGQLTPRIPTSQKFRIYVSALTQLTIDNFNRIPTTDTRLIRRMVRDRRYRGYSASQTIQRWPSVIRGEARNIFPFQEQADVIFNTALLYELSILKTHARRSLEEVRPDEEQFAEARRTLDFLHLFAEIDDEAVPPTSILREFIGGSSFKY